MLCLIPMVGGLLIMMGHHSRAEALFYYFRLEDSRKPSAAAHRQACQLPVRPAATKRELQ